MVQIFIRLMLPLFLFDAAFAISKHEVKDGDTVSISISDRDLTRVYFHGASKLSKVWTTSDAEKYFTFKPDLEGGQLFIKPNIRTRNPISFFVSDTSGNNYSIIATPKSIPSKSVQLMNKQVKVAHKKTDRYVDFLTSAIRTMVTGAAGGKRSNRKVKIWNETTAEIVHEYEFDGYVGYKYHVKNITKNDMRVHESEFIEIEPSIKAIAVEKHRLSPGETTIVYIIR